MKHIVFVYGTLMKGHCNDHYLREEKYMGIGKLKDYEMYHVSKYPGIIESKNESVVGELYEVTDQTLHKLDQLEGEGDLYKRKVVDVILDCSQIEAQAYVWNKPIDTTMHKVVEMPWEPLDDSYCHLQFQELEGDAIFEEAIWPIIVRDETGKSYEACTIRGTVAALIGEQYLNNQCADEDWKQRVQYAMQEIMSKPHEFHVVIYDHAKGVIAEDCCFDDENEPDNEDKEWVYVESERAFLFSMVKLRKIELFEREGTHYFKEWKDDGNDPIPAEILHGAKYQDIRLYNLQALLKKTWDEQ